MSEAENLAIKSNALADEGAMIHLCSWVEIRNLLRADAAELRRLSAELESLKKAMGEPVRWVVETDLSLPCCAAFDHPGLGYTPLYAIQKDKP